MRRASCVAFVLIAMLLSQWASAAMLASQFGRRYGALEIFDPQSKLSFRVNMPRLQEQLPPCSSYMVPLFAIALGTGVIKENDSKIAFDPAKHPGSENWPASWRRDQTFDTALRDSVQWYAQELALRIGAARLQQNMKRLKYGNADISGGLDKFWMSSSLRLTTFQQIDFVRNFREGKLGFNPRVTKVLQDALMIERTPDYSIYGKYGSCPLPDGTYLGWLVGYVESGAKVWYYALNLDGKSLADFAGVRLAIVKGSMQELGFIPGPPAPPAVPATPANPAAGTAPIQETPAAAGVPATNFEPAPESE